MDALIEVFCAVLLGLLCGAVDWYQSREHRRHFEAAEKRRAELEHKAERLADGLPPHERCLCAECRAWRSNPGNQELLRLRGLR